MRWLTRRRAVADAMSQRPDSREPKPPESSCGQANETLRTLALAIQRDPQR